jgi:hypothetical protein
MTQSVAADGSLGEIHVIEEDATCASGATGEHPIALAAEGEDVWLASEGDGLSLYRLDATGDLVVGPVVIPGSTQPKLLLSPDGALVALTSSNGDVTMRRYSRDTLAPLCSAPVAGLEETAAVSRYGVAMPLASWDLGALDVAAFGPDGANLGQVRVDDALAQFAFGVAAIPVEGGGLDIGVAYGHDDPRSERELYQLYFARISGL